VGYVRHDVEVPTYALHCVLKLLREILVILSNSPDNRDQRALEVEASFSGNRLADFIVTKLGTPHL
jgi:hypothetical protein